MNLLFVFKLYPTVKALLAKVPHGVVLLVLCLAVPASAGMTLTRAGLDEVVDVQSRVEVLEALATENALAHETIRGELVKIGALLERNHEDTQTLLRYLLARDRGVHTDEHADPDTAAD